MAELTNGVITAKQLGQVANQIAETFAKKTELESLSQDLSGSFGSALDNVYTKNDVYTKTESENKFQPKGNYAESSSVTKAALESTLGMSSYAKTTDLSSYASKTDLSDSIESSEEYFIETIGILETDVEATLGINAGETINGKTVKDLLDEWNAFKTGADNTQNAIDTLKEIQTYINSDTNAFTALSNTVNNTIPSTYAKKTDLDSYLTQNAAASTYMKSETFSAFLQNNNFLKSSDIATDADITTILNSIK